MASIIVVDRAKGKGGSLQDVVDAVLTITPQRRIHRAHNTIKGIEFLTNQRASVLLVDSAVKNSHDLYNFSRRKTVEQMERHPIQMIYFVDSQTDINQEEYPLIDKWYIKGSYLPLDVAIVLRE